MGSIAKLISIPLLVLFLVQCYGAVAAKKPYIVYMGAHFHGPNPTEENFEQAADSHRQFLASYVGSEEKARDAIIYSYTKYINGFTAFLEEDHAAEIAKHSSVVSVFPDRSKKLHTTRSWEFMGLEKNGVPVPNSLWPKARFGEDSIISNFDSGVWPEAESFSDAGYGPIPKRWKGSCEGGAGFKCNKKLIGAQYYYKGFLSNGGKLKPSEMTTRDTDGHGTHTLSTLGGNMVNATLLGVGLGVAKGGSPRARVASYKVCWHHCYDSDILQAFDQAIYDGVDVINLSIGGDPEEYFVDGEAIGSFHAVTNGIAVVASAGNNGTAGMVSNAAPWIFTVAASSVDRMFESDVMLGNGQRFRGAGISGVLKNSSYYYPLTSGALAKLPSASDFDAIRCKPGTLDPSKVKGKILACFRGGDITMLERSSYVYEAGAAGLIHCNNKYGGDDITADIDFLPASDVSYEDGLRVLSYIQATAQPFAYLTAPKAVVNLTPAPVMAYFSSRGPNVITPDILKPDVTAPGVDIVAAFSPAGNPTDWSADKRSVSYDILEGTSMASPHVAGLVGLLKTLYPKWSPAAIRSAIMTTATNRDNTKGPLIDRADNSIATPFVSGAGHINPNAAMDPGLVYDIQPNNYLHYLCALGYNDAQIKPFVGPKHKYKCHGPNENILLHFNYPSLSVPRLRRGEVVTLRRKVTNVGPPGMYKISVVQPKGANVYVHPQTLTFKGAAGEAKSFQITITGVSSSGGYTFGDMTWSDGKHNVRSTIAVYVTN